jgi:CheY-like chemotaxis protein
MAGDREEFLAAGMNGHIAKPVELEALLRTIAEFKKTDASTSAHSSWRHNGLQGRTL